MKRFLSTIVLVFLLVVTSFAQFTSQKISQTSEHYLYTASGSLDSASTATTDNDSLWTRELAVTGYDNCDYYSYMAYFHPASGVLTYAVEVFYSGDGTNYTKVDTLIYNSTNQGRLWGSTKIANSTDQKNRAPYVKFLILRVATAGTDLVAPFTFQLLIPESDNAYKPKSVWQ